MNITQGVPRLREIMNATKLIASPIVTAPLFNDSSVTVRAHSFAI